MARKRSRRKRTWAKRDEQVAARRLLREFVLERDIYRCQKCRASVYGAAAHTSHVLPKGKYKRLEFEPANVKLLCWLCHKWWHANPQESMQWWRERFPDRARRIDELVADDQAWQNESLTVEWYQRQQEMLRAELLRIGDTQ